MPALDFNPFDPALLHDPYPAYAELREAGPVVPVSTLGTGTWAVTRHAEVTACLRRHDDFSSDVMAYASTEGADRWLIASDPPDHTALRRMANRPFHPAAIAAMEPRIRQLAEELVDGLLEAGSDGGADLVHHLAEPLPVVVISELLGIPAARRADFKRWSDAFVGMGAMAAASPDMAAVQEMGSFFDEVIAERRRKPGTDLISMLTTGTERLSQRELLMFCVLLLVAGNETTTNLLGNALHALFAHPDQLAALRADPALVPAAVEEALRYDAPVQFLFRRVRQPVDLAGHQLSPDELVIVLFASANRDERRYREPDRFDITRDTKDHLAFGAGIHLCLGAPLARLEARIALETLLRRTRTLEPAGEAERAPHMFLRGFSRFPLAVEPA